jgi:hypothetical protein
MCANHPILFIRACVPAFLVAESNGIHGGASPETAFHGGELGRQSEWEPAPFLQLFRGMPIIDVKNFSEDIKNPCRNGRPSMDAEGFGWKFQKLRIEKPMRSSPNNYRNRF